MLEYPPPKAKLQNYKNTQIINHFIVHSLSGSTNCKYQWLIIIIINVFLDKNKCKEFRKEGVAIKKVVSLRVLRYHLIFLYFYFLFRLRN